MSDQMEKPKKKKQKVEVALTDSDEEEEEAKPNNDDDDEEAEFSPDEEEEEEDGDKVVAHKNHDGETYFNLNEKGTRRCLVKSFKGKIFVDVREVSEGGKYYYCFIENLGSDHHSIKQILVHGLLFLF
jgi:Transcriptional Coactivator p15 (PC4)